MSADLYRPCPCGSGKKIKFCCSRPILAELDRVERMIDGDQLLAARERLQALRVKHPGNPALMMLEVDVAAQSGEWQQAQQLLDQLQQIAPTNPKVHIQRAFLRMAEVLSNDERDDDQLYAPENIGPLLSGVRQELLLGFEKHPAGEPFSKEVAYSAMLTARHFARGGEPAFALAMLGVLYRAVPELNEMLTDQVTLLASPGIHVSIKATSALVNAPPDVYWHREFQLAYQLASVMRWEKALAAFQGMARRILDEPPILWNVATLLTWLGRRDDARAAWANVAAMRQLQHWQRLLAATMELTVMRPTVGGKGLPKVDQVKVEIELTDASLALERALSHPRLFSLPVLPRNAGEVPPRGIFFVADRAWPADGPDLAMPDSEIPALTAQLSIYGKETDRPARAELYLMSRDLLPEPLEFVRSVLGDAVSGQPETTTVVGASVREGAELRPPVAMHAKLRRSDHATLERRLRQRVVNERTADFRHFPQFNGTSMREAAADSAQRLRVEATLLARQELVLHLDGSINHDEVYAQLSIERPKPIPVDEMKRRFEADWTAVFALPWIDCEAATPAELSWAMVTATSFAHSYAEWTIGHAILKRADWPEGEALDEGQPIVSKLEAANILTHCTLSTLDILELLGQCQQLALAAGKLPVPWMLSEFQIRWEWGEGDECQRLLDLLQRRYMHHREVADAVRKLLSRLAARDELMQNARHAADGHELGEGMPADDTAEGARIWTPADRPSEPSSPASPSKLWVPD